MPGPIAIGGVGGSGTRIIAQILSNLGYYIGDTLNEALDNLWFTILFKRPRWFHAFPTDADIFRALALFERAMLHGLASDISAADSSYIVDLVEQIERSGKSTGASREHADRLIRSEKPDFERYLGWGWKEPNSHLFLRQLCQKLDELRYIHVIRHGLDMAFSTNQQQAMNWGRLYGIESPQGCPMHPTAMLDYWIAANTVAIRTGEELLNERFLLINYDSMCTNPHNTLSSLIKLLAIDIPSEQISNLANLPRKPSSAGRFRLHGTRLFSDSQLADVRRLGFDVL